MVLERQRRWDEGRGSARFSGVLFQGGKIDDHVIFTVPSFIYLFNHDWAKSPTFLNLAACTLLQSYNNVHSNLVML